VRLHAGVTAFRSLAAGGSAPFGVEPLLRDGRGKWLVGVADPGDDRARFDVFGILRDLEMIAGGQERFT
jgi:hypothetical protein